MQRPIRIIPAIILSVGFILTAPMAWADDTPASHQPDKADGTAQAVGDEFQCGRCQGHWRPVGLRTGEFIRPGGARADGREDDPDGSSLAAFTARNDRQPSSMIHMEPLVRLVGRKSCARLKAVVQVKPTHGNRRHSACTSLVLTKQNDRWLIERPTRRSCTCRRRRTILKELGLAGRRLVERDLAGRHYPPIQLRVECREDFLDTQVQG